MTIINWRFVTVFKTTKSRNNGRQSDRGDGDGVHDASYVREPPGCSPRQREAAKLSLELAIRGDDDDRDGQGDDDADDEVGDAGDARIRLHGGVNYDDASCFEF